MRRKVLSTFVAASLALWTGMAALHAEVQLHGMFTDNGVLQQGMPVPVWGTAADGEKVVVQFAGQTKSATAQAGKWMVKLDPMKAGGPHTMTVKGTNTLTVKDLLVGEVWACSGQSNMGMVVAGCVNAKEEIAGSANPMIRLYTMPRRIAAEPATDAKGTWRVCGPDTVGRFSAVAYFFGRELQKARGVPVGLVNTSWGGTPAEAWTSLEVLQATPTCKSILDRYAKALETLPQAMERYQQRMAKYQELVKQARADGVPVSWRRRPRIPYGPKHPHRPAGLYNGMIHNMLPYAIAGAIWYQGESNASRHEQYRTLFPAMIQCWRDAWGQGDFGFHFVQLAAYQKLEMAPTNPYWAKLREAQTMALKLPNTGMAVITDVGNESDIHPKRKQEVGARLALAARATTYGEKIEYSGPAYESSQAKGSAIEITFSHAYDGLVVKGDGLNSPPVTRWQMMAERGKAAAAKAKARADKAMADAPKGEAQAAKAKRLAAQADAAAKEAAASAARAKAELDARPAALAARNAEDGNCPLKGFTIAGKDANFVWAQAKIVGPNKVLVSNPKIPEPVAVRYAWENYTVCNLYNTAGLPAAPFRTDEFPLDPVAPPAPTKK